MGGMLDEDQDAGACSFAIDCPTDRRALPRPWKVRYRISSGHSIEESPFCTAPAVWPQ